MPMAGEGMKWETEGGNLRRYYMNEDQERKVENQTH